MNTSNGDAVEKTEHRKDLNPFATEEDDDSDGEGDFTIGDLEAEEEGKGHLPPGTGLVGAEESLLGLEGITDDKNVGTSPDPDSSGVVVPPFTFTTSPEQISRATFPSMWPFGNSSPRGKFGSFGGSDRNHFRGASADDDEQSNSSDDSDDEYKSGSEKFGGDGQGEGKRRLSVTTEAKRRTSLEDDDEDEEVVHVGMAEAREEGKSLLGGGGEQGDDEELVEIQHAEMQGVEREGK